jgi:hypothetical protein
MHEVLLMSRKNSDKSKPSAEKIPAITPTIEEANEPVLRHDAPVKEVSEEVPKLKTDNPPLVEETPGRVVYVTGSKFSKSFVAQAAQDYQAGKVKGAMQIMLPDGQIITAGPTYESHMGPTLMQMIKRGVVQASNFGKLAKRR